MSAVTRGVLIPVKDLDRFKIMGGSILRVVFVSTLQAAARGVNPGYAIPLLLVNDDLKREVFQGRNIEAGEPLEFYLDDEVTDLTSFVVIPVVEVIGLEA